MRSHSLSHVVHNEVTTDDEQCIACCSVSTTGRVIALLSLG